MAKSKKTKLAEYENQLTIHLKEAISLELLISSFMDCVQIVSPQYMKDMNEELEAHRREAVRLREDIFNLNLPPKKKIIKENPVISWLS